MPERRRVSLTTVVWGVTLLIVAALIAVSTLTGLSLDPLTVAAVLLLLAGLALILGAALGGRRRG